MSDERKLRLRVGRKVGRTLYQQAGDEPSDDDLLVGLMDTPGLAGAVVALVDENTALRDALREFVRLGKHAVCDMEPGHQCSSCAAVDAARSVLSPGEDK